MTRNDVSHILQLLVSIGLFVLVVLAGSEIKKQRIEMHELQREQAAQKAVGDNDRAYAADAMARASAATTEALLQVANYKRLATEAREAYNACR